MKVDGIESPGDQSDIGKTGLLWKVMSGSPKEANWLLSAVTCQHSRTPPTNLFFQFAWQDTKPSLGTHKLFSEHF